MENLAHRFAYHPPQSDEVKEAHGMVRDRCADLAWHLDTLCPDSREKSLAITALEESMMWANAAIARNQ